MVTKHKVATDAVVLGKDVAELTVEAASDVVEALEAQAIEYVTVVKNNPILLAGVALVSISAGGVVGYKWAERKLQTKFDAALEAEIAATKKFVKTDEFESVASATKVLLEEEMPDVSQEEVDVELRNKVAAYLGGKGRVVIEEEIETTNVFVDGQPLVEDDWVTDVEDRNDTDPYIVSLDEYMNPPDGQTQVTLTYYAGDDTLVDEQDDPIDNVEATVGTSNLGTISSAGSHQGPVFVRNPRTEMDFEVVRHGGSFARIVLGLQPEIKTTPRKMRAGDDG